jgi:hypothetical protein
MGDLRSALGGVALSPPGTFLAGCFAIGRALRGETLAEQGLGAGGTKTMGGRLRQLRCRECQHGRSRWKGDVRFCAWFALHSTRQFSRYHSSMRPQN